MVDNFNEVHIVNILSIHYDRVYNSKTNEELKYGQEFYLEYEGCTNIRKRIMKLKKYGKVKYDGNGKFIIKYKFK